MAGTGVKERRIMWEIIQGSSAFQQQPGLVSNHPPYRRPSLPLATPHSGIGFSEIDLEAGRAEQSTAQQSTAERGQVVVANAVHLSPCMSQRGTLVDETAPIISDYGSLITTLFFHLN